MSTIVQSEPCTFKEAVKQHVWKDEMNEEYDSIMKNDVWDVVPKPKDKSVVTSKWLYKIKHGADGSDDPLIHQCKRELASEFEMKDLGLMHYLLGLEVWQKPGEIFLSQGGMVDCKSVTNSMELNFKKLCGSVAGPELASPTEYRQLVGALIFLVNSCPDICFAVNTLNQ
eukprot:PITA_16092